MSEKIRLYRRNPHRYDIMILLAVAIVLFIIGITEPVVTFEKMIFEKNSFSILSGIIAFFRQNQMFIGIIVFLFSIVFPVVKFIWLIIFLYLFIFFKWKERKILKVFLFFDDWSMIDVFGLSLLVYLFKISGCLKITLQTGFSFLIVTAVISVFISIRMAVSSTIANES